MSSPLLPKHYSIFKILLIVIKKLGKVIQQIMVTLMYSVHVYAFNITSTDKYIVITCKLILLLCRVLILVAVRNNVLV